jgi:Flp pilus assembly protein CpaB
MTALQRRLAARPMAAHRRLLAALLAGLAMLAGIAAVRPAAPPTVTVLVAARDLAAGAALRLADLRSAALPSAAVPAGALRPGAAVLGRLVAGPVRRGEPLTDVRVLGPALLTAVSGGPDVVAVPVRFADAGAVSLLRPGDRIDVLGSPPGTPGAAGTAAGAAGVGDPAAGAAGVGDPAAGAAGVGDPAAGAAGAAATGPRARVVAAGVAVLVVAGPDPGTPGGAFGEGALVVVACSPAVARDLAGAAATERLSPALRAPLPGGGPP